MKRSLFEDPRQYVRPGPRGYGNRSVTRSSARSGRRPVFIAVFVVMMILITTINQPSAGEVNSSAAISADYGVFQEISDLHDEEMTRGDSPEVIERVTPVLDSIVPVGHMFVEDGSSAMSEEQMEIPLAITKSPVIFDALKENPIINNTSIMDWILPPPASSQGALNYLVLVKNGDRMVWKLGSMTPKIGLFTDSGLDKWVYIDVDGDPGTGDAFGNDIRARMTFSKDLLARDWEISLLPPKLEFNNAGIRIEVQTTTPFDEGSGIGGSIYFIKGISYSEKNYIWSVGMALDEYRNNMILKVQANKLRAEPQLQIIQKLLQGGFVNIGDIKLMEILGPFKVSYLFDTPPEKMDVFISVMRLEERSLRDMAYIKLGLASDRFHQRMIDRGTITLGVKDMGSPIDSIEWRAGENGGPTDSMSLSMRYTEFSTDLVDAHIDIPVLPGYMKIEMDHTIDEMERNRTILDARIPGGLSELYFIEVIYPSWVSEKELDEWNATSVRIYGIPETLHIETTAAVSFSVEDNSGINLNIIDSFMTRIAGRFYRLGQMLRQIPVAVSEMPSTKGSTIIDCGEGQIGNIDFISSSGTYLNGSGDMVIFHDGDGKERPSIHATLSGISYYRGIFEDDFNDIMIRLRSTRNLEVHAVSKDRVATLNIKGLPDQIRIRTEGDLITYEGSNDGFEARKIDSIGYRFREDGLRFDVDIKSIPSKLSILRSDGQIEVSSGSGAIGSIEMFISNSSRGGPLDLPERNFLSVISDENGSSVGLRLNKFRSFVYNNGTDGFIEINTATQANFYTILEDSKASLYVQAAFVPLPTYTRFALPSMVDTPEINIPDIMGAESIDDYGDLLLSLEQIGKAPLKMASSFAEGLVGAIGQYSTGLSLSWDLAKEDSNLDLILLIRKTGELPVAESKWTHGIWMEQAGMGDNSSIDGKIYLNGMPTSGEVNLSFSDQRISVYMDFVDYSPDFSWFLVRTTGVQDRDISLYLTGVRSGIDLLLDMMIHTDLSIGGRMVVDLLINVLDQNGNPVKLGSMLATLIKAQPILSIRQMYLPVVPSVLDLYADVANGMVADYSASERIEYLYFKITKRIEERWSQIYAIFHDVPTSFYASMTPNNEFTIQEPFITQGLPRIDLRTDGSGLGVLIEYDGSGFGQRGKFQIYADDLRTTKTYYEDGDYVIDSEGIGFLYLQVDRLPVMEQFTLSSLIILGMDIKHVRISSDMVYGIYPMIFLRETRGGSFQIKVSGEIEFEGERLSPDLFFITLRTTDVGGRGIPTALFINKDTSVLNMDSGSGAVVMPAPILTAWYHVVSPLFGGG